MRSQRLTRLLRGSLPAIFTLSLTLAALPPPVHAGRLVSLSAWRPGWLPGDPEPASLDPAMPIWSPRAISSGLLIAIDPVTHRPIAPTEAQKRAFAEQEARDVLLAPSRPLQVEKLPGGGEIIHLNGQYQVYSIARRDALGHVRTDCVPDPGTARKVLAEPSSPPTKWEEK